MSVELYMRMDQQSKNMVTQKVTRDSALVIQIPNLLGDSKLRDCISAIRISNPQPLRRQQAERLHIGDSNLQSRSQPYQYAVTHCACAISIGGEQWAGRTTDPRQGLKSLESMSSVDRPTHDLHLHPWQVLLHIVLVIVQIDRSSRVLMH